jgi:hypothetical protein
LSRFLVLQERRVTISNAGVKVGRRHFKSRMGLTTSDERSFGMAHVYPLPASCPLGLDMDGFSYDDSSLI